MTGLFNKSRPPFGRVLLIESGSRQAADRFLQYLYQFENCAQVDVLTCFSTPPEAFQSHRGQMFLVTDPAKLLDVTQRLRENGIHASNHYWSVADLFYGEKCFPNTNYLCPRVLNLWVDDNATESYITKSCDIILQSLG